MHSLSAAMSEIAEILENILAGRTTEAEGAATVVVQFSDLEDQITSKTLEDRLFKRVYWSIVLLREPERHRTKREELLYLRDCLRNPSLYDEAEADKLYRP